MKNIWKIITLSLLPVLLVSGCKNEQTEHNEGNIQIKRFEQVLFETPESQLCEKLDEFAHDYRSPLLNIIASDPQFMQEIIGYINDSTVRNVYNITNKKYGNLFWLENELTEALKKAHKVNDEIDITQFATFVSVFFDYDQRILVDRDSKSLLVSIDQYALPEMERFSYFNLPMFIVSLSDSIYLASDIMAEIARQYIAIGEVKNFSMLDYMIMEGKVLYFLDEVMPDKADFLKIRYTPEQLDWCNKNEAMIWAYFIQHNLLYEKDMNRFHNFMDEAPKTNAFKDSAPRTTQFIGWHIVRSYMKNNNVSMKELFANTNSQAILQASQYKP